MEQVTENAFRFNTGRGYSKEGQIIEVEVVKTIKYPSGDDVHRVRFADHTRRIYGIIDVVGPITQQKIMAQYDQGLYEDIVRFELGKTYKEY